MLRLFSYERHIFRSPSRSYISSFYFVGNQPVFRTNDRIRGRHVHRLRSNAIYRLVQRTIVNWTIVNCYDSIYPSRSLFFYAYRFVSVTDHVRSFYHVTARKGVRAKQGYRYRVIVNSALFRSSVNNEACKYAMWTPQQIAAVSTKAFHRTIPGIKDTERTINRSSNVQSFLIDNLLLFPYLVSGN